MRLRRTSLLRGLLYPPALWRAPTQLPAYQATSGLGRILEIFLVTLQICDRESFPNKARGNQQVTDLLLFYGKDALEQKLDHYRYHKANTMDDLLWYMLNSLGI